MDLRAEINLRCSHLLIWLSDYRFGSRLLLVSAHSSATEFSTKDTTTMLGMRVFIDSKRKACPILAYSLGKFNAQALEKTSLDTATQDVLLCHVMARSWAGQVPYRRRLGRIRYEQAKSIICGSQHGEKLAAKQSSVEVRIWTAV
jgi:hypothetical protein